MTKMKLMISSCLLGTNCKYNGGNNLSEELVRLVQGHEVIPFCPEVSGGLSTPRIPSEIKDGRVINQEGKDVHDYFAAGAYISLQTALREKPNLIVLQSRSPSCGVGHVYDGTFTGTLVDGDGITVQLLKQHGFHVIDVKEFIKTRGNENEIS